MNTTITAEIEKKSTELLLNFLTDHIVSQVTNIEPLAIRDTFKALSPELQQSILRVSKLIKATGGCFPHFVIGALWLYKTLELCEAEELEKLGKL